ncbi:YbaB/EbfC family nucleoid-associated protein [Actinophytocola xinjiangensis]|nr:YbaB/EbfC family nucleoid-associated protein [Actinophytocola xinjiangensis]
MAGMDPGRTARDLEQWAAGLEQRAQRFTDLHQRMNALRITETSSDGAVRVTVDGNGSPTELTLTERSAGVEPGQLSAELMSCLHRAQAGLRAQVEQLTEETVGDDEAGAVIVDQYTQRFPDRGEPDDYEERRIGDDVDDD